MVRRVRSIELVNCVIKPVDEYGLYNTYKDELFTLLSRTCINMFSWEIKDAKSAYRLVTLDNIDSYKALLERVNVYDPPEVFVNKLLTRNLPEVYGSHDMLVEIAQLRLWQWQKYYRGGLNKTGNKIEVQFKSKLNLDQERKLHIFLTALYGENYEMGLPSRDHTVFCNNRID